MLTNGQDPSKFLERIKKQAKSLFKLKKENQIQIESLSDAQNLVAQISGYPNWHALQTNIKREEEKLKSVPALLFKNKVSGAIKEVFFVDSGYDFNLSFVLGDAGTGKTIINKNIAYSNVLKRQETIKTSVIDRNSTYKDLVQVINKERPNKALTVSPHKNFLNILDLPLGFVSYSSDMVNSILNALKFLISEDDRRNTNWGQVLHYFKYLLNHPDFIKNLKKMYVKGVNQELDNVLKNLALDNKDWLWSDLSLYMLTSGNVKFAHLAAHMASPTLSDLIKFIETNSAFQNDDFYEIFERQFFYSVRKLIKEYPEFDKQSNWLVEDFDFLNFDLSNYCSLSSEPISLFTLHLSAYFSRVVFMKKTYTDGYDFSLDSSELFQRNWQEFIGVVDRDELLAIYEVKNRGWMNFGQIIFDGFDKVALDDFNAVLRDLRKNNLGVVWSCRNLKNHEHSMGYLTQVFIHSNSVKENKALVEHCVSPKTLRGENLNGWYILSATNKTIEYDVNVNVLHNCINQIKTEVFK